ncbi:MAG: hypothetical protein HFH37_13245 [Lachnospiraceae bacterium]|nr:hypothetical protein [Lachnospiraceae bacterium]
MNIKGISPVSYPLAYGMEKEGKDKSANSYPVPKVPKEESEKTAATKKLSLMDIYNREKSNSKTSSDIIVKPDGSRVLVVTMSIGGMETTMSLEISKPTDMPNASRQEDVGGLQEDMGDLLSDYHVIAK